MPMFYEECATPLGNLLVVTQHLGHLTHIVFDASTDRRELARAARVRANAHSREMTRAVVEQIQRYFARDFQ